MKVSIKEIGVKEGRRSLDPVHVKELAESIRELGLLNPLTVDREKVLIAGLHRLEAVKLLGWAEVECTVSSLEGLQAELAEIDENFVRSDLSVVEYGEMLLRRKEIYEAIHPEVRHGGDRKSGRIKCAKCTLDTPKSFVDDTAEKLKVDPCTVRRQIQTARNLTPETKEIIKDADTKISRKAALKLSRLAPGQQREAAQLLAAQKIRTVDEYVAGREEMGETSDRSEPVGEQKTVAYGAKTADKEAFGVETADRETSCVEEAGREIPREEVSGIKASGTEMFIMDEPRRGNMAEETGKPEKEPGTQDGKMRRDKNGESGVPDTPSKEPSISLKEIVAELKNPDKDCSGTPDSFLQEYDAFVRKFHREIGWYSNPYYDTVYPLLTAAQLAELERMTDSICSAAEALFERAAQMRKS